MMNASSRTQWLVATMAALCLSLGGLAAAQPGGWGGGGGRGQAPPADWTAPDAAERPGFAQALILADADANGLVSAEEFLSAMSDLFLAADQNADGSLDAAEVAALAPTGMGGGRGFGPDDRAQQYCILYDADQDGQLSLEEYPGTDEEFAALDANDDGYLTPEEVGLGMGLRGRPDVTGAPRGPIDAEEFVATYDVDDDGQISLEEFPGLDEHFAELDANQDGFVTAAEIDAWRLQRFYGNIAATIAAWDLDGDGSVSLEEYPGYDERFAELDLNGDGLLTAQEMIDALIAERDAVADEDPAEDPAGEDDPAEEPPAEEPPAEEPPTTAAAVQSQLVDSMIARSDRNGNGQLSRDEFSGSDPLFQNIDANGDGELCTQEFLEYGGLRRKGK